MTKEDIHFIQDENPITVCFDLDDGEDYTVVGIDRQTLDQVARSEGYEKVTHCWLCMYFEPQSSYKEDRGQGMIETIKEPPGCSKFKIDISDDQGYCSFAEPLF